MKKVIYLLRLVLLVCLFIISYNNSYSQTPARTKAINTIVDSLPDNNTKLITPSRLRYTLFRMLDATKDSVPILDMINLQKNIPNGLAGLDGAGKILTSQLPSETDPTVASWIKSITSTEKSNWNTAFAWGNHASAGYLVPIISSPTEGQVLKYISGAWRNSSASNSPDSTTASNGLGLFEKDVQLGGTLNRNTGIEGPYQLEFAPKVVLMHPIDTLNMYVNANPSAFILITTNGIDLGTDTRIDGGLSVFGRVDLNNSNSPLGLPTRSSDPIGTNGDIYYNTSNNTFRIYENSTWKGLPTLSDAAADGVTKGIATYNPNDFNSSGGVISLDYNNMQIGNDVQSGILTPSIYNILNQGASNGLSKSGNDVVGGGPLTGSMIITGTTNAHKVYIRGNDESGIGADGVFNTTVRGVNFFDSPTAIYAADSSDGGGWGLVGYSTNGVGISGTGLEAGITGGTTNTGPGVKGMLFGVNNTNYAPITSEVWGHNSGTGTSIFSALDLIRTNNGSPITGAGVSIRWKLPYQHSSFIFNPIQTNTIESVLSNNLGVNFTSDLRFTGVKDSIYGTYMVIKGGGQLQLNNYGDGLITGTATRLLAVDVDGNVIESSLSGGITASNGLNLDGSDVQLGGALTENTTITSSNSTFKINISGNSTGQPGLVNVSTSGTGGVGITGTASGSGGWGIHGVTTDAGGRAIMASGLGGGIGVFSSSSGIAFHGESVSAKGLEIITTYGNTNSIGTVNSYTIQTAGTAANGIGGANDFLAEMTNASNDTAARITWEWTNATAGSQTSALKFWTKNNAGSVSNKLTIKGAGQLQFHQYGDGLITGTPTQLLGVDVDGNLVEMGLSGGTAADNGLHMDGITAKLGGTLTETTNITGADTAKRITISSYAGLGPSVLHVINNYTGLGASSSPAIKGESKFGGIGIWAVSNTGTGLFSSGSTGVDAFGTSGPAIRANKFDTTTSPVYIDHRPSQTGSGDKVYTAVEIYRETTGPAVGNGIGSRIAWTMAGRNSGGIPAGLTPTTGAIEVKILDAFGPDMLSQMTLQALGDSTTRDILIAHGSGQVKMPFYGDNTFAGTPAYALGVDASGNVVEFSAAGITTPTWDAVMTAGDDLTSTYTTTFSGSNKWILNGAVGSIQGVLEVNNTSGSGAGVKIVSTSGYGIEASGAQGGVRGTSASAPAVQAELFNDPNLNAPLMSTNTGRTVDVTNVIGGLDLIRSTVGGTPGSGTGMNLRWMLPNNDGTGPSYRTSIDAVITNATPASYAAELRFRTTGSGSINTGMILKGTRQLQLNAYGVNTFAGTPAYALGVDASGNLVEFSAAGGATPTIEQVATAGSAFSTAHTFTTGSNVQSFTGTNTSGLYAYAFSNTGNGGALSATSDGASVTFTAQNSSSGNGALITNTSTGVALNVTSVDGAGLTVTTDNTNAATFTINPATTNTTERIVNFSRRTSGTAANNMGGGIGIQLEDAAGANYTAAQINSAQTDATNRTTSLSFNTLNAGTNATKLTISGAGQLRAPLYGVGTFTGTTATFPAFDASGNIIEYTKQSFFQTATGTVTNTSAETTVISTGVSYGGGLTIPVAKATVGRTYKVRFSGIMTTGPSGSSTFTFRVKLGSVILGTTGSIFIGTNVTRAFDGEATVTIRSNGATGTVACMGFVTDANSGNTKLDNGTTPTATVDFTVPQTWDITTQMGTASTEVSTNVWIVAVEEVNFNN